MMNTPEILLYLTLALLLVIVGNKLKKIVEKKILDGK